MRFENKVALITGSGRGIGQAIALHFAREGADVVVNFFRNRAPAEATAGQIRALGRRAFVVRADVGQVEGIKTLFAETEKEFGGLDILVCNAASGYNRPVMEQKIKGWDWTLNINARSALFCAQRAAPLMERRARWSLSAACMMDARLSADSVGDAPVMARSIPVSVSVAASVRTSRGGAAIAAIACSPGSIACSAGR